MIDWTWLWKTLREHQSHHSDWLDLIIQLHMHNIWNHCDRSTLSLNLANLEVWIGCQDSIRWFEWKELGKVYKIGITVGIPAWLSAYQHICHCQLTAWLEHVRKTIHLPPLSLLPKTLIYLNEIITHGTPTFGNQICIRTPTILELVEAHEQQSMPHDCITILLNLY